MAQTETQAAAPETTGDSATENQETTQESTSTTEGGAEQASATTTGETTEEAAAADAAPQEPEEISYHAVEKEGHVAAIWEMQGRKHLRTIDPRSGEGKNILSLFTSDHHEEEAAA
jgi:hypothetical protein